MFQLFHLLLQHTVTNTFSVFYDKLKKRNML